ncbi:MAG: hypothetical protein ORN85_05880, partial [Sediminibacterium sp.]|nr:hypothetical protein [Sediminibacterium sp.]
DFIPIQVKPINEPKITIKFNSLKDFRNNIVCPGESVEYFKPLETPMVIDLHLNGDEKISDNSFLEFQLKKAESQFDLALVRNVGKIIFITGKGKGVLKEEIIKLFNQGFYKNKIESIDSGYHPVYEYGAITYNLK